MAELTLPRLGQGMESGTIVRWLKAPGDSFRKGEPLYELDTEKVTQEVEAESDGVLLEITVASGEVPVGTPIAVVGESGSDAPAAADPRPAQPAAAAAPATGASEPAQPTAELAPVAAPTPEPPPASVAPSGSSSPPATGHLRASPLARRIAREQGVELAAVVGTGPDGRVLAADVERAARGEPGALRAAAPAVTAETAAVPATAPASAPTARSAEVGGDEVEVIPLSRIRKTIAERLTQAWTAPVFHLGVSVDVSAVLALRETLVRDTPEGAVKPTVNDVFVRLVAAALGRHPAVNAHFVGDAVERHRAVNVGVAVAAPQGLVVPVIRNADRLSVREIAAARADLVGRARDGKLQLDDLAGGTFSVSNLGMFGIEQFTAVLNPPQVAILAIGAAKQTPTVVDGAVTVASITQLMLTCDHRAIDGADGAAFVQTLVALIEQPALAL